MLFPVDKTTLSDYRAIDGIKLNLANFDRATSISASIYLLVALCLSYYFGVLPCLICCSGFFTPIIFSSPKLIYGIFAE